jgi:outer membrane biosynthesis protein TonB
MRSEAAVIAAALALALTGCASHAKPMAASQPAPLSIPQTHVTLPPPQPLDPDALAPETDVKAPETPTVPPVPAEPAESAAPAPTTPPRRPPRAVAAQPVPPPVAEQPTPPPVERPPIQAVVPAQEQKRLKALAQARKKEAKATLARMSSRHLSADDQDLVKRIQFFLDESNKAEDRGDMSQADVFAQRAQDLARGWQGGR